MATPEEIALINVHAQRIRGSGLLGRSSLIQKLFDYLVECANQGRVPKEIEVAIDGFGKGVEFDASQDALVRVYVHKLRRKLDEFYTGPARDDLQRIAIPKGEYRFAVEQRQPPVVEVAPPSGPGIIRRMLPWPRRPAARCWRRPSSSCGASTPPTAGQTRSSRTCARAPCGRRCWTTTCPSTWWSATTTCSASAAASTRWTAWCATSTSTRAKTWSGRRRTTRSSPPSTPT